MTNLLCFFSGLLFQLLLLAHFANAQVRLPNLVRDGMVLQREVPVVIWGWAAPGEEVTVQWRGKKYPTKATAKGTWQIQLPEMKAGGPYPMDILASNRIHLENILIGDVWLCSGQSNMVIPMERVKEKYPDEIKSANYPHIRTFLVPVKADATRVHEDVSDGKWLEATPQNILAFGAVSYFFAKKLYTAYRIPIGIINASVGGTPIEAWISEEGLKPFSTYVATQQKLKDTLYVNELLNKNQLAARVAAQKASKITDKGLLGPKPWFDTTFVPEKWHTMMVPGSWEDQGVKGLNGVVWFRKEIHLPASFANVPAKLMLGRIVDADYVYVNGLPSGSTSYQYPPRRYELPAGRLKAGKNVIVVRVINYSGKGGFVPDKPYYVLAGDQKIELRGEWQYQVGDVFTSEPSPPIFSMQDQPTSLYNAMIAPLTPFQLKGMVWYQGETNTSRPAEYRHLLPALIADWRRAWKLPNAPFLYAQLANFMEVRYSPSESQWAVLRESQLQALAVPNTGMAVAIDAGEWNDIHPLNKKDVGERLALAAQKIGYGDKQVVASGPLLQSHQVEGNKIILSFGQVGSGLMAKDSQELAHFAIAGADKKFVWAKAVIEGNNVVVWHDDIAQPRYVRYAWADNPEGANLYNREGLPASPFRTDK